MHFSLKKKKKKNTLHLVVVLQLDVWVIFLKKLDKSLEIF